MLVFPKFHVNHFVEGGGQRENIPVKWNQGDRNSLYYLSSKGDPIKLLGDRFRINRRRWLFRHSTAKWWNSLLQDLMDTMSLHRFKTQVDKFMGMGKKPTFDVYQAQSSFCFKASQL